MPSSYHNSITHKRRNNTNSTKFANSPDESLKIKTKHRKVSAIWSQEVKMSDIKPEAGNVEKSNTVEELTDNTHKQTDDTAVDIDNQDNQQKNKAFIFGKVKIFDCNICGKKCYCASDYPYDICTDCNVKALEKKIKYLSARPTLYKLEEYLRENFDEDDEVTIGTILDIIEDFQN